MIHGSFSNPNGNWFPWLKGQLEGLNVKVYAPQFPINEGQSLQNWLSTFGKYMKLLDRDTIMVGHSIGPAFILNILERNEVSIKAAFFVAPFIGSLGIGKFDTVNKTFMHGDFDWKKITGRCNKFYIYSSDNDPYVPLDKGTFLSRKLNANYKLIKNGGHMNSEAGYKEFPLLLDDIKKELGK
jgi:hypothetical protein